MYQKILLGGLATHFPRWPLMEVFRHTDNINMIFETYHICGDEARSYLEVV